MKKETCDRKAKELHEKIKNTNPRFKNKIAEMKEEEKRLKRLSKEKAAEEEKKTEAPKKRTNTSCSSTKKASTSSNPRTPKETDSLTEAVRAGMSEFNPYAKKEFDGMNKEQLKDELNFRVHEMMEMNATCVKEGLKSFSSEQQFINESIAEVCQEQHITIDQYNEFMKS